MSWCRGLAGIGQTLLRASGELGDASLAGLAREAADICIAHLPRVGVLGRCCGAAGIGSFLIDLAIAGQDDRYWRAAERVSTQMLLRSAGPPGYPVFVRESAEHNAAGWAAGVTGLLSFYRRLARPGEPDRIGLTPGLDFGVIASTPSGARGGPAFWTREDLMHALMSLEPREAGTEVLDPVADFGDS
jgi:hypothetical protein